MKICDMCNKKKDLSKFYSRSSKCKECLKSIWSSPEHQAQRRLYRKDPKVRERERNHHRRYNNEHIASWEGYIPLETNCEICGDIIYFGRKNPTDAICFDHKSENCLIKGSPYDWLCRKNFNEENRKIWDSCNFGKLCRSCNHKLPTRNRKEWWRKVTIYIEGEK